MGNSNKTPWGGIIIAIIVIMTVGWVCNYLEEQSSRMSGLANTIIGLFILGAFYLGYMSKK